MLLADYVSKPDEDGGRRKAPTGVGAVDLSHALAERTRTMCGPPATQKSPVSAASRGEVLPSKRPPGCKRWLRANQSESAFGVAIGCRSKGGKSVPRLVQSLPSITATSAPCPQCGKPTDTKLVEPHPMVFNKEKHTFECRECGLPRTYTIRLN
jgi:hypothetical protein